MSSEEESGNEYESEEEVEEESGSEEEVEEVEEVIAKPVKKKRKGKKKNKDPNKPKRNMSAFFLYSNDNRSRIKQENPSVPFGEIAKILSTEYKALSEKDKKKWEKKAAKDKVRYQNEMKSYTPPSDDSEDEAPRKKKKAKKDPNKPKRNQSAFFIYSNAVRSDVKEQNPEAKFGDIAKIISVQFKALSSKERSKYDKLAAKDKERYQEEMAAYNEN